MTKDISQQKIFRKIVIQKDREAKNLAENGIEALAGLKEYSLRSIKVQMMRLLIN